MLSSSSFFKFRSVACFDLVSERYQSSLFHPPTHPPTHTLTHTLSLSLSLTHTHTHTLSLSHTHTHTLSLSPSLTHIHTYTRGRLLNRFHAWSIVIHQPTSIDVRSCNGSCECIVLSNWVCKCNTSRWSGETQTKKPQVLEIEKLVSTIPDTRLF